MRFVALFAMLFSITLQAAPVVDDFNSYEPDVLVGQGGWIDRVGGTAYGVNRFVRYEGARSIVSRNLTNDSVITKTGTLFVDGGQSVYIRTEGNSYWGDYAAGQNVQVRISRGSWDSEAMVSLALKKNGQAAYWDPAVDAFVDFSTYTSYSWTLCEIEWRAIDTSARYRINGGLWTNWKVFRGAASFTGFDTVGFDTVQLHGQSVYFDTLGEIVPEPASLVLLFSGAALVLRRRR